MYKERSRDMVLTYRHFGVDWRCCFDLLRRKNLEEQRHFRLQQTQLAGASYGFSALTNF